jgi:hypothetical protein
MSDREGISAAPSARHVLLAHLSGLGLGAVLILALTGLVAIALRLMR